MNIEHKKATEPNLPTENAIITQEPKHTDLQQEDIAAIMQIRKDSLSELKPSITLKLYYQIEEKLKQEEQELNNLLDIQLGRTKVLGKYTFVLDPQYFEQIFFS
jgi:hypothetical protein